MPIKRYLLAITLPLYVLDQITKWLIVFNFPQPSAGSNGSSKVVPVIEGYFNIVRVHNQGVAFGFGNVTDRLLQGFFLDAYSGEGFLTRLSKGYVVDFLDFTIPLVDFRWPSFNVADSCICVAAFLLILSTFRGEGGKEASDAKK
jgi:signal peptidase II